MCQLCFRSRKDLLLENLVLRQQLAVFEQRKQRPKLDGYDKLFWLPSNACGLDGRNHF